MKILIAEDDLASRKFLLKFLSNYGVCDITVDGLEAMEAYLLAFDEKEPYDLIFLDIIMPKMDGQKVLKAIRDFEIQKNLALHERVKIIMTTGLNETENVFDGISLTATVKSVKYILRLI